MLSGAVPPHRVALHRPASLSRSTSNDSFRSIPGVLSRDLDLGGRDRDLGRISRSTSNDSFRSIPGVHSRDRDLASRDRELGLVSASGSSASLGRSASAAGLHAAAGLQAAAAQLGAQLGALEGRSEPSLGFPPSLAGLRPPLLSAAATCPAARRAVLVSVTLMVVQQLSGVNNAFNFSSAFLRANGMGEEARAPALSLTLTRNLTLTLPLTPHPKP